jgi:predicted metal-binding membrane protein
MRMNTVTAALNRRPMALKAMLVIPTVAAWIYVCLTMVDVVSSPAPAMTGMHHAAHWNSLEIWGTFSMWMVMMVAMMIPTVFPWALAFARHARGAPSGIGDGATALVFLTGYFAAWLLFATGATALQWYLSTAGLLSPSLIVESAVVRGVTFVLLGAYQWSPLKESCLKHCESPFSFFLSRWRDGRGDALIMGAHHGLYCVGCCWALMVFMFAVGAMSFPWMVGFTLYMLSEMYVAEFRWVARAAGAMLIAAGLASLVTAL